MFFHIRNSEAVENEPVFWESCAQPKATTTASWKFPRCRVFAFTLDMDFAFNSLCFRFTLTNNDLIYHLVRREVILL